MQSLLNWIAVYNDGTTVSETELDTTEKIDRDKLEQFRLYDSEGVLKFVYFNQKNRKLIFRRRGFKLQIKEVFLFKGVTEENYAETSKQNQEIIIVDPAKVKEIADLVETDAARYHFRLVCKECGSMHPRGSQRKCEHEDAPETGMVFDSETEEVYVQNTKEEEHFVYLVGWHEQVKGVSVKSLCYVYDDGHIEFDDARNDLDLLPIEEF